MLKKVFCAGIIPLKKEYNKWMVLLVQHTQGHYWAFPKGQCEGSEKAIETAKRELKEETDLEIDQFLSDQSFKENYQFSIDGQKIDKFIDYFVATVKGAIKLQQPEELENAQWFTLQDALKKITYPESKQLFKKILEEFHF